ncbi:MarR family transcriptional regulator [Micromonospora sp. KC606]|uniref:MarR family winged helix-turn-helix transcriptional regulator n=1 Tax=Micromonospora sp. KC606 TaxID=2530379 RepID=UPI00104A7D43|nr:MarR family transcriptional regulator [Micromonospora sp. KC606]TDC85078.1 MarR family transcriptional regulator [Micromonospora sp. KC606]
MTSEVALIERWRSLLASYNRVSGQLDRALQDRHALTLTEFETLDRLTIGDGEKRRMQDLAGDMHLSQSALSRTVDRLEKRGLVRRAMCEADRRGVFVAATEEGVRRHVEARRSYLAVLTEHLPPNATCG